MREVKFLGKVVLFCLPVAIIIGFPAWVMYRSGEFASNDAMAAIEVVNPNALVGPMFSNPVYYVQLHAALLKGPDVLVLGSSRVQQIRASFFGATTSAYIAAGTAQKISHFREFLDQIPASQSPKVIILGLDQKFFNPGYDSLAPDNIPTLLAAPTQPMEVFGNWASVYRYYFQKKFSIGQVVHAPSSSIGLAAIALGAGYRNDGSHAAGNVPEAGDPTMTNIQNGIDGFQPSENISVPAVAELDAFLAECKTRGIYVIGFVPPFKPDVYAAIQKLPSQFGYLKQLSPVLGADFNKYQFGFYDFTDPASLKLASSDFQDGIHLNETGSKVLFNAIKI